MVLVPGTDRVPEDGLELYVHSFWVYDAHVPEMLQSYDPGCVTVNESELDDDVSCTPLNVTDHASPDCSPVSENTTL